MKPDSVSMKHGVVRVKISVADDIVRAHGLSSVDKYPCGMKSVAKRSGFRLTLYFKPSEFCPLKNHLLNEDNELARQFLACMRENGLGS